MISQNIFSDDEFKKQILSSEGLTPKGDYEIQDFKDIVASAPSIPKGVKTIIQDASLLAKKDKEEKASEINRALNKIFTDYNQEYGTNLQIDFGSLSKTLVNVSDPKSRRTLELYVSEVFKSARSIILLGMISKLALLIDHILDPNFLFNKNSFSPSDLVILTDNLFNYIEKLEAMKKEIIIPGASLELKKLGEELTEEGSDSLDTEAIQDFMELFNKEHL